MSQIRIPGPEVHAARLIHLKDAAEEPTEKTPTEASESAMTLTQTALVTLGLLLTPGPTNTLIALSGAERGWTRALRLIPAELAGYLLATVPLALVGARLLETLPTLRTAITLGAALWVLWLAVAMWRPPLVGPGAPTVTVLRVFATTLLNPKTLVFGLVLLPAAEAARQVANFALFALLIASVAAGWAALGAGLRRSSPDDESLPPMWRRAASLWLGALAVFLFGRAVGMA